MDNSGFLEKATFAGGCFWCTQHEFDQVQGVIKTTVGYTGGTIERPSYRQVCSGSTGHVEAILVEYDPQKVSYQTLLEVYWKSIDPTNAKGQFCDIGSQYRPMIFFHNPQQGREAEASKKNVLDMGAFCKTRLKDEFSLNEKNLKIEISAPFKKGPNRVT